MREIKFRAWHKQRKTMCHFDIMTITKTYHPGYWHTPDLDGFDCELDDLNLYTELMQYTGLKDKNGKEIYEGDIIENVYSTRLVEFYCGAWWMMDGNLNDKPLYGNHHTREVIGNIYENAELVEVK